MASLPRTGKYSQVSQDDSPFTKSLVAPDPKDVAQPATAAPVIEVIAPATLVEGYQLDTMVGDQRVTVLIPPGGVEQGQKFLVPMPTPVVELSTQRRFTIPVGHWKDGLCDCFSQGCCHPACCWCFGCFWCLRWSIGCCWWASCAALGASQVGARLHLNFWGLPSDNNRKGGTSNFAAFLVFSLVVGAIQTVLLIMAVALLPDPDDLDMTTSTTSSYSDPNYHYSNHPAVKANAHPETPAAVAIAVMFWLVLGVAYLIVCYIVIYNVRSQVRKKFSIPENEGCPTGCEDVYTAVCCPCCTTAQMMRHTGDYDQYPAKCCSGTGLPDYVSDSMIV